MEPKNRYLPASSGRPLPRAEKHEPIAPLADPGPPPAEQQAAASGYLQNGAVVASFEIERELAHGPRTFLYEARELDSDRLVALKVLRPELRGVLANVARFRKEAELASRVSDPTLVQFLGAGTRDGVEFQASRLMHGPTLAQFIDSATGTRGELFFRESALRFARLARSVEALHRAGVLHRKIRPSSIFLEQDLFVLGDFDLAADLREVVMWPPSATDEGASTRGRIFQAPEEFVQSGPLDLRTDVYSLGMSLYELATGMLPFPRCNEEALARLKLTRRPIAPRRVCAPMPLGLDAIIRQAIEASPNERHQSTAELAEDLERFAARKRGLTRHHEAAGDTIPDEETEDGSGDTVPAL